MAAVGEKKNPKSLCKMIVFVLDKENILKIDMNSHFTIGFYS